MYIHTSFHPISVAVKRRQSLDRVYSLRANVASVAMPGTRNVQSTQDRCSLLAFVERS